MQRSIKSCDELDVNTFSPLKFTGGRLGGGQGCAEAFEMPGGRRAEWTDSHNESENLGGEAKSE